MNEETKRSRMRAGAIGAAVGVAAIGAIVVIATNRESDDEDERVSSRSTLSARDVQFPRVEPGVQAEKPMPKWEREPHAVVDTKRDPVDPPIARNALVARQGGILGKFSRGTSGLTSGFDDKNVYGGLLGNEAGEMKGGFGFGRSGFGPGGGGTGWGTIGTGRYGTIGRGSGGGGYGVGGGRGRLRGKAAKVPRIMMGAMTVTATAGDGDLDKAIVRRYVRRNIQKLQYCYEKELLVKPKLAGTVSITFKILETGGVSGATAKGVDPTVETCMAGVIGRIEFPRPKGTGGVTASFSATLSAS